MTDVMRRWDKWDSPTCLHNHLRINDIMEKKSPDLKPSAFPPLLLFLSLILYIVDYIGFHGHMEDFNWILCAWLLSPLQYTSKGTHTHPHCWKKNARDCVASQPMSITRQWNITLRIDCYTPLGNIIRWLKWGLWGFQSCILALNFNSVLLWGWEQYNQVSNKQIYLRFVVCSVNNSLLVH